MERRETYATTGPRMVVRFFGGLDFDAKDAQNGMPANVGYAKGVPMGGDIQQRAERQGPDLPGRALKDPDRRKPRSHSGHQGMAGCQGRRRKRRVYEVVWSDPATRKLDADGKLPAVGNTVDVANATWTNTIGEPELITVWKDPDFDPAQSRVLLRARPRDSDAALDGLRREVLQDPDAEGSADDAAGARLHVADLVHAVRQTIRISACCVNRCCTF